MSLRKDLVKHQYSIQRLAGTQASTIKEFLNILKETATQQAQLGARGKELRDVLRSSIRELPNISMQSLEDIAIYESEFTKRITNKYSSDKLVSVDPEKVKNTLRNTSAGIGQLEDTRGKSLSVMYSQFANRKSDIIARVVTDGRLQGLAMTEIASQISDRIEGFGAQARVLAETSVNYSAAIGRDEVLRANEVEMVWISLLDTNTCGYCASNHLNNIDDIGDTPPAHWGCQCHIEPLVD